MRSITPCATMPVGANGDSVPASAPLPAMIAISSGGMPARAATAIAGGASNALAGVAPAPIVAIDEADHEEHDRQQTGVAAAQPHGALREPRERAVDLGDREQQRHADERDEQIDGKALEHLARSTCRARPTPTISARRATARRR